METSLRALEFAGCTEGRAEQLPKGSLSENSPELVGDYNLPRDSLSVAKAKDMHFNVRADEGGLMAKVVCGFLRQSKLTRGDCLPQCPLVIWLFLSPIAGISGRRSGYRIFNFITAIVWQCVAAGVKQRRADLAYLRETIAVCMPGYIF